MAQLHKLKIHDVFYQEKIDGNKPFEIRDNSDRGFQKGDAVKYLTLDGKEREGVWIINYVTNFQQKPDYVVFSDRRIEE